MRRFLCVVPAVVSLIGACSSDPFEFNFGLYDHDDSVVPAHSTTINGAADDVTELMFADYATANASAPLVVDVIPADGSATVETAVKFSYCEDNFGPAPGQPNPFADLTYVNLELQVQADFSLSLVSINCMSHDTTEFSTIAKLGD